MVRRFLASLALSLVASLVTPNTARANERRFTFTYETGTLPVGARELEVWTTHRSGRDHPISVFDHRFEFEVGVAKNLMTAFYVNASSTGETLPNGQRQSTFDYGGFSNEWKWKLLDPVADSIGLALYGELSFRPTETEYEAKVLLDKRIGGFLFAFNAVGEVDAGLGLKPGATEKSTELKYESDLALAYLLPHGFGVGLEGRHMLKREDGMLRTSVLYAGPTISYATDGWWVAMTAMRQVHAFKGATHGGYIYDDDHETLDLRVLFSFHI